MQRLLVPVPTCICVPFVVGLAFHPPRCHINPERGCAHVLWTGWQVTVWTTEEVAPKRRVLPPVRDFSTTSMRFTRVSCFFVFFIVAPRSSSLACLCTCMRACCRCRVDVWMCGCVGVWMCWCLGVWVSGCGCAGQLQEAATPTCWHS